MEDVDYVRSILLGDFETSRASEIPYPNLEDVIGEVSFEYLEGLVHGERPNGSKSREGQDYLWFNHGTKSILSHRFIVAVTLGKWPPRDFHVDHVNHNPSDNRPANLRVVTPLDNAKNRRKALLSELVDLEARSLKLKEQEALERHEVKEAPTPEPEHISKPTSVQKPTPKPTPPPRAKPTFARSDPNLNISFTDTPIKITYTGETKPAKHGGAWHKTNLGSWHLIYEKRDTRNKTK